VNGVAVGPASLVRGAGVLAATLTPSLGLRVLALASSYGTAWSIKPGGLTFLSVSDSDHDNAIVRAAIPLGTSGASWTAVHLGVTSVLRRSGRPLLAGAVYGVLVAALDAVLVEKFDALKATAAERAAAVPAADPVATDESDGLAGSST